jgi:hypothetical protein
MRSSIVVSILFARSPPWTVLLTLTALTLASAAEATPAPLPGSPQSLSSPTAAPPSPGQAPPLAPAISPSQVSPPRSPAKAQPASPDTPAAALDRAAAAYEYGDLAVMVESVRPITEGALPASDGERADALRFLGIGLFLTDRIDGAQAAFLELLKLRPGARLDPTLVKPDAVAFFESVKRAHLQDLRQERRKDRSLLLNFLPPLGQIQNHDSTTAWVLGGAEVLTFGAALFTYTWLTHYRRPDKTFYDTGLAQVIRGTNWVANGALAATYIIGVTNGLMRYYAEPSDDTRISLVPFTSGSGLAIAGRW